MNSGMWPACSLLTAVLDKPVHYTVGIICVFPHFLPSPVSYTLVKENFCLYLLFNFLELPYKKIKKIVTQL